MWLIVLRVSHQKFLLPWWTVQVYWGIAKAGPGVANLHHRDWRPPKQLSNAMQVLPTREGTMIGMRNTRHIILMVTLILSMDTLKYYFHFSLCNYSTASTNSTQCLCLLWWHFLWHGILSTASVWNVMTKKELQLLSIHSARRNYKIIIHPWLAPWLPSSSQVAPKWLPGFLVSCWLPISSLAS